MSNAFALAVNALTHADPRLRWWGRAFAVASLVHLTLPDFAQPGWWAPAGVELAGALWLLWRPALGAFALCAIGTAWPLLALRDVLTQSMYLTWCASAAAVGVFAHWRGRRRAGVGVLDAVTLLTAGTYLLAALHKLNEDFFDPEVSCADHAWDQIVAWWSGTGGAGPPGLAVAVVLLEIGLAVALVRRSPVAWWIGVAFHVPLTVTLAPAFGAVMLSGYVATITPRQAVRWRRARRRRGGWIAAAGLAGVALAIAIPAAPPDLMSGLKVGAAAAIAVWAALAGVSWRGQWRPPRRAAIWLGLAWTIHGLTPYFGLQYQHAAAMLSNLRVDDPCHNSWLAPRSVRLVEPYLRIDVAAIGHGQRPKREQTLRNTLWNIAALHVMHDNWCIAELRPIRLAGTWRGRSFDIPDLCAADWSRALPGADVLPYYQALQKNLPRRCHAACIH